MNLFHEVQKNNSSHIDDKKNLASPHLPLAHPAVCR